MAVRRLPVIEPAPAVDGCRNVEGHRPCPVLSCPRNLLLEVLGDGSIVLHAKVAEAYGERLIVDKHEYDRDRVWYVAVRLPDRRVNGRRVQQLFALGPCGTGERARAVADAWEERSGAGTTRVHRKLPAGYQTVGPPRDGPLDRLFADLAEDAVEEWFDEPDPNRPSCLRDEVAKMATEDTRANAERSDGALLDKIADIMHVSRERVRQIEISALRNFAAAARQAGFSPADLLESD